MIVSDTSPRMTLASTEMFWAWSRSARSIHVLPRVGQRGLVQLVRIDILTELEGCDRLKGPHRNWARRNDAKERQFCPGQACKLGGRRQRLFACLGPVDRHKNLPEFRNRVCPGANQYNRRSALGKQLTRTLPSMVRATPPRPRVVITITLDAPSGTSPRMASTTSPDRTRVKTRNSTPASLCRTTP